MKFEDIVVLALSSHICVWCSEKLCSYFCICTMGMIKRTLESRYEKLQKNMRYAQHCSHKSYTLTNLEKVKYFSSSLSVEIYWVTYLFPILAWHGFS